MSVIIENNQETTSEKETTNVVLGLETLTAKYDILLMRYKQISTDYTNYLKQTSPGESTFTTIQGKSYWGTGTAGDQSVYSDISSVNVCQAMCASTSNCTGATYKPNVNGVSQCFLRSGESETIPSGDHDYAIVPLDMFYLIQMKDLNKQLSDINNKILEIIKNQGEPLYSSQVNDRDNKSKILKENYFQLLEERENISAMIKDYNYLNTKQNENDISINQKYYSYILLLFIAVLCVYILIRVSSDSPANDYLQSGGNLSKKTYYVVFTIVIAILVVYYFFIRK